jgi:hypothetical protein
MKIKLLTLAAIVAALCWISGCQKTPPAGAGGATTEDDKHAHSHEGESDELFWHRDKLEHEGHQISLGQHGIHLHAGEEGELAVIVTKDGQSVADAKVFVTVLDKDGNTELVAEQAAEYETVEGEPPHYASKLAKVPDAKELTVRYRITLPAAAEFKQDVPVETHKH